MDGLQANTEGMNANGKSTIQSAEYFETQITNLKKAVDGLDAIWSGEANEAFVGSYHEQEANLKKFQELLNELGERIVSASVSLDNTESDIAEGGRRLV